MRAIIGTARRRRWAGFWCSWCVVALVACGSQAPAAEEASAPATNAVEPEADRNIDYSKPAIVNRAEPEAFADGTVRHLFDVRSPSMKRDINVAVVVPPGYDTDTDRRYPVLYAMHGARAPYKSFTDMAPLRRVMKERPFILVTFNGDAGSWYVDSRDRPDSQFTTFFFDELIGVIDAHYRTRTDALSRGTTGFSMGGYGAFHYMLTRPDLIGSASALSGAFGGSGGTTRPARPRDGEGRGGPEGQRGGSGREGIESRIEQYVRDGRPLPPMYMACGTEDRLLGNQRRLVEKLIQLNAALRESNAPFTLSFEYRESAGGHDWPYWRDASPWLADFHWRVFQTSPEARK